jgi:hypothetical protein
MDVVAAPAAPWLVLGAVLGLLLAAAVAGLVLAARSVRPETGLPPDDGARDGQAPTGGWLHDDLPAFHDSPPGSAPATREAVPSNLAAPPGLAAAPGLAALGTAPFAESTAAPAVRTAGSPPAAGAGTGRVLLALIAASVVLVGAAALVAVLAPGPARDAAVPGPGSGQPATATPREPGWTAPDLPAVPVAPSPTDPGAGRLAALSVPVGDDGALARLAFEGVVLERRAVGVTVAYPSLGLTAGDLAGGPALAHLRLPTWNCLTDSAPADPVAAGCLRTPTEYAELPAPALKVSREGDRLRLSGRFPTYVRPSGSPPAWTGRVYPVTVTATGADGAVEGRLTIGRERTSTVPDRALNELRLGR